MDLRTLSEAAQAGERKSKSVSLFDPRLNLVIVNFDSHFRRTPKLNLKQFVQSLMQRKRKEGIAGVQSKS